MLIFSVRSIRKQTKLITFIVIIDIIIIIIISLYIQNSQLSLLDGTIKFLLVTYVQSWKWDVRFQSKEHFSYRRIAWAVWSKKNNWVISSGVAVSLTKTTKPFSSWGILFFLRVPIKTFWQLIFVSIIKAFPEYVIKT